jgi:glycosyltransferase involved in cell wall biosynthesis
LATGFIQVNSIIITTYNRPDALALVLNALAAQSCLDFEVIIADDGSSQATFDLIQQLQLPYFIRHIWQADEGFRAAMARNRAAAAAQGDYFIFLDGDCVPTPDFVFRHQLLAEKNCFVAGNRILLSQKFTDKILPNTPIWQWKIKQYLAAYLRGDINRILPLLRLPDYKWRKYKHKKWQGAKTCNLAVWRDDFFQVNGFDEQFQGWGHEDAEFVVRLLQHGVIRKEGRFAVPVLHLWHPEQDRQLELVNRQRLEQGLSRL